VRTSWYDEAAGRKKGDARRRAKLCGEHCPLDNLGRAAAGAVEATAPFYAFPFARVRRRSGEFTPAVVDASSSGIGQTSTPGRFRKRRPLVMPLLMEFGEMVSGLTNNVSSE
jgi:hypothetical protein